jgi:hypothetical protein
VSPAADQAPGPAWRAALVAAIEADPRGMTGVALRLEVSRPYVSRVMTGHIPEAAVSPRFVRRVEDKLMQVDCPHLGAPLARSSCAGYAGRSYAQISAHEVAHWRACRRCPHNPAHREAVKNARATPPAGRPQPPAAAQHQGAA